jgi:hypothetical protein
MPELLSVGDAVREVARLRGVVISPRTLTELVYRRALGFDCPLIGGRRMLPAGSMPDLLTVLEERGYLTPAETGVQHAS